MTRPASEQEILQMFKSRGYDAMIDNSHKVFYRQAGSDEWAYGLTTYEYVADETGAVSFKP